METNKKQYSHKIVRIVSGVFLIISVIVFLVLGLNVQRQDLKETYALAEETQTFLGKECEKYNNYILGLSAQSSQGILDKAIGLRNFISKEQIQNSDFLQTYIRTEHLGGVIVLDQNLSLIAQADMDDLDSYSVWKEVIEKQGVKSILTYPKKKFIDHVKLQDKEYDYAAISDSNGGVLLCYSSTDKPSSDPYEFSINKLLENNTFHKNPIVIITDGNTILSTNDQALEGMKTEKCRITKEGAVDWKTDQLTKLQYKGGDWYGLHRVYNAYSLYVLYPSYEVFSDRTNYYIIGFMIYLIAGVMILFVQRYFDKQNLRKTQKQLRIINAITTSYMSTFLFHIDEMKLEPIKISEPMKEILKTQKTPVEFFEYVIDHFVAEEYRQEVRNFMEIGTIAERLKDKKYLGLEVCGVDGIWYGVSLVPQRYDAENQVQAVLITIRDVTTIKQAEELSFRDKLTGLYNRNYMESRNEKFVREGDLPVSLIMADCNYLKRTNDTLGHEYGDLLLKRVAAIIRDTISENDLAMRVGGDEFVILCTKCTKEKAGQLIDRIKEKLAAESNETLELSVAFGVHTTEEGEFSFTKAYELADQEMYLDKKESRRTE